MRTLVEHAGVVVVDTLDELVDVSEILARFPKPSKGDLGILTFSGAFCGIAHDFCEDIGVRVPPLSPDTLAHLTPILPSFLPPKNPLDLGTQTIWQPELVQICVEALLRDPAIGGLAISIPPTSPRHAGLYIEGIIAASKANAKPVALAILGDAVAVVAGIHDDRARQQCRVVALVGPHAARDGRKSSTTAIATRHWQSAKPRRWLRCRSRNSDKAPNRNGSARRCSPLSACGFRLAISRAAPKRPSRSPIASAFRSR